MSPKANIMSTYKGIIWRIIINIILQHAQSGPGSYDDTEFSYIIIFSGELKQSECDDINFIKKFAHTKQQCKFHWAEDAGKWN